LIWTGQLFRINIEMQEWMTEIGLDLWSNV